MGPARFEEKIRVHLLRCTVNQTMVQVEQLPFMKEKKQNVVTTRSYI